MNRDRVTADVLTNTIDQLPDPRRGTFVVAVVREHVHVMHYLITVCRVVNMVHQRCIVQAGNPICR